MGKRISFLKKSIKGLFVIGMTVQICMGVIWMCVNLFSVQRFGEAAEYIEMSSNFVLDEYVGILYPTLLFLLRFVFGKGLYFTFLYVLQLVVAFAALCIFLRMSGLGAEKCFCGKNTFRALYLMTIPFVLQLHMAVLPISLVSSVFVFQLAICFKIYRDKEKVNVRLVGLSCVLWTIMALLAPDYIWLGAVPVIWMLIMGFLRKWRGKEKLFLVAGIVMALFVTGLTNSLTQQPGSRGNIQRTLGAAMVSRLAWPSLESNYYFWPQEVKEIMSPAQAREIDQYADNVKTLMGPLFEEAFGKEKANDFYWKMALRCFSDRTKEVLPRIEEDLVSYLFTPFSIYQQISGGGYSYSGWNFERMWEQNKALTGAYVTYSLCSFFVGMIISAVLWIAEIWKRRRLSLPNGTVWLCVLCVLSQTFWYMMVGTYMMDYKNVPVIIMLWYACILAGVKKVSGEETC